MKVVQRVIVAGVLLTVGFFAGQLTGSSGEASEGEVDADSGGERPDRGEQGSTKGRNTSRRGLLVDALVSRDSAREIFERALDQDSRLNRVDLFEAAVSRLRRDEIEGAFEWVEEVSHLEGQFLTRVLLARLAEFDGPDAIERAMELPAGRSQRRTVDVVFRRWAQQEPRLAADWALELPPGSTRNAALQSAAYELAAEDPERAVEIASQVTSTTHSSTMNSVLGRWAEQDPEAALAYVDSMPAAFDRGQARMSIANRWANEEPLTAMEWADSLENEQEAGSILSSVLRRFAERDPEGAFQAALDFERVSAFDFSTVATRWVRDDPDQAVTAIEQMPQGGRRAEGIRAAAQTLANEDPMEAARLATELEAGPGRSRVMQEIARELAERDVEIAAAWASELETEEERSLAYSEVAMRWSTVAPAAAARFVSSLTSDEARVEAEYQLVRGWSTHSSEDAADWLRRNGSSPMAFGFMTQTLLRDGPDAALSWVESLSSGPGADRAFGTLVSSMRYSQPEAAWPLTQRISDDGLRREAMLNVARTWMLEAPDEAREFIRGAEEFTALDRANLLGEELASASSSLCLCGG